MTFLFRFVCEHLRMRFYALCVALYQAVALALTLTGEYIAHITLHQRRIGLLQREFDAKLLPDGILWVRNYEEGAKLTPFPFRISNRWMLRKFHGSSPGLQLRIMAQAHDEDLRPARVVMTQQLEVEFEDIKLWNQWHRLLKYP